MVLFIDHALKYHSFVDSLVKVAFKSSYIDDLIEGTGGGGGDSRDV